MAHHSLRLLVFAALLSRTPCIGAQEERRDETDSIEVAATRYLKAQLTGVGRTISLEPRTHAGGSWLLERSAERSQALAGMLGASVERFGCSDTSRPTCPRIEAGIGIAFRTPIVRDSIAELDVEVHAGGMGVDTYELVREGAGWRVTRILRRRAVSTTRMPAKPS